MAKKTMKAFERAGFDKEKKGEKEGSRADMKRDKKQITAFKKGGNRDR